MLIPGRLWVISVLSSSSPEVLLHVLKWIKFLLLVRAECAGTSSCTEAVSWLLMELTQLPHCNAINTNWIVKYMQPDCLFYCLKMQSSSQNDAREALASVNHLNTVQSSCQSTSGQMVTFLHNMHSDVHKSWTARVLLFIPCDPMCTKQLEQQKMHHCSRYNDLCKISICIYFYFLLVI